jgi:hypothetical protein
VRENVRSREVGRADVFGPLPITAFPWGTVTDLLGMFSPEIVAALEKLVDARVEERLAQRESGLGGCWLYGDREAARYLSWPLGRVQKLSARGRLPSHRIGQRKAYRTDELDSALESTEGGRDETR